MPGYITLVHQEGDSAFGVSFPDFPGCITAGESLQGALDEAADVLAAHIAFMQREGDAIPPPSGIDAVRKSEDLTGAVVAVVTPASRPRGKSVRLNISLDEYLLADVDRFAAQQGLSRSAFIADATRRAMLA